MTKQQTWWFFILAGAILIIGIVLAGFYQSVPNPGFRNAGEVLTFITLASVGIERILEGFWTYIGLTKGTKPIIMIGSSSHHRGELNRALKAQRDMGSSPDVLSAL